MSGTPMGMRRWVLGSMAGVVLVAVAGIWILAADPAVAADGQRQRPIVLGQTEGWANGELTVFDYGSNFICTNPGTGEGSGPLNFACDVLAPGTSRSALNLPGFRIDPADVLPLIVILPFFDADGDGSLGNGAFVPDALDPTPGAFVQCPETQSTTPPVAPLGTTVVGAFGHCIFHDTNLDVSAVAGVVSALTGIPVETLVKLFPGGVIPLPNHTHIVGATPGGVGTPWRVLSVLVTDQSVWPDENGDCTSTTLACLTSFDAITAATEAGAAVGPVDTNLILFFGVHGLQP